MTEEYTVITRPVIVRGVYVTAGYSRKLLANLLVT
jgi:hypothetical protein